MRITGYGTGVAMIIIAASMWSTMGVAIRALQPMDTWQILFWRSLGMIPVLSAFIWWRSGKGPVAALRGIGLPGVIGAMGLVAAFGGGIHSLQTLPLANAVFLFSSTPFLTALLGRVVLGEKVRIATWAAILIAAFGIWRMIGGMSITDGAAIGTLSALGSALGFAIFTVTLRLRHAGDSLPNVILGAVFAMVTAALVLLSQGLPLAAAPAGILGAMALGAAVLGLGLALFTLGSRTVPASEISLFGLFEVMLAPVWAWIFLSEIPERIVLEGGALILVAVVLNAMTGARQVASKAA
jgi:drug/metabolite transporter, DME family